MAPLGGRGKRRAEDNPDDKRRASGLPGRKGYNSVQGLTDLLRPAGTAKIIELICGRVVDE